MTNKHLIPGAIITAALLIAGGIILSGGNGSGTTAGGARNSFGNNNSPSAENMRPVDDTDHVRGNPDAAVTIVEYSDFECPFCGRHHPTLVRIIEEFSDVRWVYRHFPLTSIHSHALTASLASECIAELGGNDAFWSFADSLFENQGDLGEKLYGRLAGGLEISEEAFQSCLKGEKHLSRVLDDGRNAVDSGGTGTPFSVIISKSGALFPFSGALRYEQVRGIVVQALES